ncbi:MAG: TetR-family transcriptional regulator [Bradyrhizobium sp.]|jgi:AcrR family transcriptional regulator|nr:TetR-family transcriptional regulator [Bradyrhizobium sp.]
MTALADIPLRPTPRTAGRKPPVELLDRLMDAAFDAFAAHGYEGASMRQIAGEAGTTIQRILYHVCSKEELWKQVMQRVVDRSSRRRQAILDVLGNAPAAVRLRHIIIDMVNFLAETPGIHRIMTFEAARPSARLTWLCDNFLVSEVQGTVALIEEAQREGAVRQLDPARLRYAILSICAVPFTIAAEYQATTGHDPFEPDEIEKTIGFICALVFVES